MELDFSQPANDAPAVPRARGPVPQVTTSQLKIAQNPTDGWLLAAMRTRIARLEAKRASKGQEDRETRHLRQQRTSLTNR